MQFYGNLKMLDCNNIYMYIYSKQVKGMVYYLTYDFLLQVCKGVQGKVRLGSN